MSIAIKVKQVHRLYEQLEKDTVAFQGASGIHCLSGCGHCCTKPDIEATVLEFLPYAFHLFLNRLTQKVREDIVNTPKLTCQLYQPLSTMVREYQTGRCGEYANRGLICRLFGYATNRDKNGNRVLSTCKWIKSTQADKIEASQEIIQSGKAPNLLNYYQKLVQIDFKLGQEYLPVNQAILRAIDEVEHYYQYRPFPYRHRKSA